MMVLACDGFLRSADDNVVIWQMNAPAEWIVVTFILNIVMPSWWVALYAGH